MKGGVHGFAGADAVRLARVLIDYARVRGAVKIRQLPGIVEAGDKLAGSHECLLSRGTRCGPYSNPRGAFGLGALNAGASGASAYQWILNGTTPIPGANGPLLVFADAAAAVGSYTCIAANQGGSATSSAATVSLASTSDIGRLVNISCRALSEAGSNQLIAGYVIGGQGTSGLLPVLIRASGPALANFGVSGTLADPKLTLNKSNSDGTSTVIGTDSGWGGNAAVAAAASEVGAFAWTASTSLD